MIKIVWLLFTSLVFAQTPEFEVASIRLNTSADSASSAGMSGQGVTIINMTLRAIILNAYGLRPYQLSGGPGWLDRDHFDIAAKVPKGVKPEEVRKMMQALLARRFGLQTHRETRELLVFDLRVAKGGLRLPTADGPNQTSITRNSISGQMTIATLADALARATERPVVNLTEAGGRFRVDLCWAPLDAAGSDSPSLFTSVQEQLGLRLEAATGQVEVWFVDRANPPSDN